MIFSEEDVEVIVSAFRDHATRVAADPDKHAYALRKLLGDFEEAVTQARAVLTHIDRMRLPQEAIHLAELVLDIAGEEHPGLFDVRTPVS